MNTSQQLPAQVKNQVISASDTGVAVVSPPQAQELIIKNGGTKNEAEKISSLYEDAQIQSLRNGLFLVVVMSVFSLFLSRNLPKRLSSDYKTSSNEKGPTDVGPSSW